MAKFGGNMGMGTGNRPSGNRPSGNRPGRTQGDCGGTPRRDGSGGGTGNRNTPKQLKR